MHITAHETGVVRLFALELDQAEAKRFDAAALGAALGGADLDDPQVDIIDTDVLDELGLSGYLTDGMGVPEAEIAPLAARIDALDGWVVVVRSAAFGGQAVTLTPRAPLRWVASFGETPLDLTAPPLTSAAAKGTLSPAPPAAPPVSHRKTLLWVLAALAFFILATISMLIRITA